MRVLATVPAIVVAAFVLTAGARQAPPQPPQQPTFRTGTEVVRVDVTVIDGRGTPVTSLTADDFEVFEDGVPQRIQSFRLVDLRDPLAAQPIYDAGTAVKTAAELARDDVRMFLVFWDEYHIPPHVPAQRLRDELVKFLRTMLAPADVVALMDPWTPMSHLQFTRDVNRLLADAVRLQGRQGVFVPPRNVAEENQMRAGVPFAREQVALTALKSAMLHLATLRDGRKTLLYLGREFGLGRDTFTEITDLIQTANDANVAVYSISPEGLTMRRTRQGVIGSVARNSGGEAIVTNAPELAFRRAVTQASAYYLLGYAPQPAMKYDGRFHEIEVKVKQRGLQVRARSGYWAPSLPSVAAARKKAAEAPRIPTEVNEALSQLARLDHGAANEDVRVRTVVAPDAPDGSLQMPAPAIWRVRQPSELREAMSAVPPPPVDERTFKTTDRLIVRFGPAGPAAAQGTVAVTLMNRQGQRLTDLPFVRDGAGWMLDLPLGSIARGGYLLMFEVRNAGDRAAAYVPIRID